MRGIHRSPVNSPKKGQWRGPFIFSLICAWMNDWANNREACDLKRNRAHCDVIVMNHRYLYISCWSIPSIDNMLPLQWRNSESDGLSNHRSPDCLLNRLFKRRWKTTSKLCVTGLCEGIQRRPVNSPHKGTVTRKMFPFDYVIMWIRNITPSLPLNPIAYSEAKCYAKKDRQPNQLLCLSND